MLMRRLNLLHHKRSVRRHWEIRFQRSAKLPEIVLEGEHVMHTDEDGNILLSKNSDQWLHEKEKAFLEFEELFDALESDPDGKGRELAEEFLQNEAIMIERFNNTIGPIHSQTQKPTNCIGGKPLKVKTIIGSSSS